MSDVLRCPTVTLMDRSEAHVGHAAVSDSDSQRTRALGGARKNVSKTGTERIMHAYEKCLAPISDPTSTFFSSNKDERQMLALFDLHNLCDAGDCEE